MATGSIRLAVPSGETTIFFTERLTLWFGRFAVAAVALSGGIACGDDATSRRLTEAAISDPDSPATGSGAPTTAVDPGFPQPGVTLAAPQQLLASALSLSQVRLSWKDASGLESGFEIYRSTTGSVGPYSRVSSVAPNITTFTNGSLSPDRNYCYRVRAAAGGGAAASPYSNQVCTRTMAGSAPIVRVATFGDSNTDWGLNGTNPQVVSRSYISQGSSYLTAMAPHGSDQLAAKIEARWRAVRSNAIRAVNHAISSTTTGGGGFGGSNRHHSGAAQARTMVSGVTRFEGEVLGLKWPWSGGEPITTKYTNGPVRRVQSFTPGPNDFVYVSMGTNDPSSSMSTSQTLANLGWMIERWRAAGRSADHFMLTTLAPRAGTYGASFPALNTGIRALAASQGVVLIDLASYTSADNGRTWRSSSLHVGDGVHYSEPVRDWLAAQVVAEMRKRVP